MPSKNRNSSKRVEVPSEHGFWVMLPVVLLAAIGRAGYAPSAIGVAVGLGALTVLLAGRFHKHVRRDARSQVAASAALVLVLVPVELLGHVSYRLILADSLAWMPVFAAFSLSVRAVFARARKRSGAGSRLTIAALLLPIASGLAVYSIAGYRMLGVSILGLAGCIVFAIWRPKPRQLKQAGIMMTVLLLLALALMLSL